jgi:hypothetical protein
LKAARDLSFVVLKRWKEALYMNLKGSLKGPVEDKDGQGLSWIYIENSVIVLREGIDRP